MHDRHDLEHSAYRVEPTLAIVGLLAWAILMVVAWVALMWMVA